MEEKERQLVETEARSKSNQHRIDKLEQESDAIHDLSTSIQLMARSIEQMTVEIKLQGERISTLEKEPAKRWNHMLRTIFTAMISTLTGGLVGALVTMMTK